MGTGVLLTHPHAENYPSPSLQVGVFRQVSRRFCCGKIAARPAVQTRMRPASSGARRILVSVQLRTTLQAVVVFIGLVLLVLFLIAFVFGLGV